MPASSAVAISDRAKSSCRCASTLELLAALLLLVFTLCDLLAALRDAAICSDADTEP